MSTPPYKPKYRYTQTDFEAHFDKFIAMQPQSVEGIRSLFRAQYNNRKEADWKSLRFLVAMAFLDEHRDAFKEFSGETQDGHFISQSLLRAAYSYFAGIPDEFVNGKHAPKALLAMARNSSTLS